MLERSSKEGTTGAINVLAVRIVEGATPNTGDKNLAAVVLGRLGGKKGGKARAKKLTPERKREIARKAALARWGKRSDNEAK